VTRERSVWIGLMVAMAVAIWLTAPAWGARPQGGDDVMGHLVRGQYGVTHIINHLRLDGWFPRFMVGHQEYMLYGPAFDWMLAGVRLLSFGLLSEPGAMKVLTIASVIALPPAVAYLARSFGLSRRGSVIAAVLALAVDNVFGVGLSATFTIGLVPQQVAAPFWCVAVAGCWRLLSGAGRRRDAVVTVASMSVLILLHPISVLVAAVVLGLAFVVRWIIAGVAGRDLLRLMRAGLVTAGLTAFWLLPYLVHRNLKGPVATWDTPELGRRIHDILHGNILFGPRHVILGLTLGELVALSFVVVAVLFVARRSSPLMAVVIPLGYLLVAHGAKKLWPTNEVSLLLANRGLGYAGLVAIVTLAFVIDSGTAWLSWFGDIVAVVMAVALVVIPIHGHRVAREQPIVTAALRATAVQLHALVPVGARFAVERDYPDEIERTGITQPNLWLAYWSGRNELNVFNGESSASAGAGYIPDEIHAGNPGQVVNDLTRLGTTHLVTVNPETPARYAASGRARIVWEDGSMAILSLSPPRGQPDPASLASVGAAHAPATAELVDPSPERPRWQVSVVGPTPVTLAVAWSPKWTARVDGRPVPVAVDRLDKLVSVTVPDGSHVIALTYGPDGWDRLGVLITLATLATLAVRRWRPAWWWGWRLTGPDTAPDDEEGGDDDAEASSAPSSSSASSAGRPRGVTPPGRGC